LRSEEGFAIYIGSAANAANSKALNDAGVKYILNVSERVRFRRMDGLQITMYHAPLSDYGDTPLSSVLEECFAVINEARGQGNILVHCQGGVNRSPTIVIAYLMAQLNWSLKKAWDLVKERRSIASPHEKYMYQLIEFEKELFGNTTIDYNEYQSNSIQASLRRIQKQFTLPNSDISGQLTTSNPNPNLDSLPTTNNDNNNNNNFPYQMPQLNLECIS